MHDEAADIQKEMAEEAKAGGDIGSLALSLPSIRKEWKYIVVSVVRLEDLPIMDGKVGALGMTAKQSGTDAFCTLIFAGGKKLKTKIKTTTGESRVAMRPVFLYEMWYPVSIPTMTQVIKFGVWDHDPEKSEFIGQIIEKFNKLDKQDKPMLRWYNLYGAPEFKDGSVFDNMKKVAVETGNIAKKAAATIGVTEVVDWYDYYNTVPDHASTYKGRCLLQFRVATKRPESYEAKLTKKKKSLLDVQPFQTKMKPIKRATEPPTRTYYLKALVISGNELPYFTAISMSAVAKGGAKEDLEVRITVGLTELKTARAKYEDGMCRWNQLITSQALELPLDPEQVPDIFIYLYAKGKPVCFRRIKPYQKETVKTVDDGKTKIETNLYWLDFDKEAQWFLLEEDKVVDALNDDDFPGSVLMRLGFGPISDAAEAKIIDEEWKKCNEDAKKNRPFQVRMKEL